jgi:N-acetylglucosaminyldiphosphoundecaprenol N-acetyl-beta-D-mannosaminyltransferase
VNVLGVRVATLAPDQAVAQVLAWCHQVRPPDGPRYVCATSVHGIVEGRRDGSFRGILNRAALVLPDGMPLVWFGRLAGRTGMQRVYGPGFMESVCRVTAAGGVRHFFYGGAPGVADELARRTTARFPGLVAVGSYCPPFRALTRAETDDVVSQINQAGPDIVWVGLSTPKQERWIGQVRERLTVKLLISVGAAFDYHTGRLKQAPRAIQRTGLEWAFRLAQEPGRLWRRYAVNNPRFIYLAALQLAGLAKFPIEP